MTMKTNVKAGLVTLLIGLFCLICSSFAAQAQLVSSGKIEFERKSNLHKLWGDNSWMKDEKDKVKPFYVRFFDLSFNTHRSWYKPGREAETPKITWGLPPGAENVVVQDFDSHTLTAQKTLYEQTFLIKDSLPKYRWKILSEVREIAGYKCRKAITIVCDSVYVVAFYTDEIPLSAGPEQMGGLPGMILELAVPRLYTTWVATKVELTGIVDKDFVPPSKGKASNLAQVESLISASLKDWGKWGRRNIWWMVI
ncbi:MAG: GLPGLI family protein [Bacteroidetes bacterium]|nr:GLPGLI family protein [Bacteroidota bacterium]